MRLLELHARDGDDAVLEFHPNLTVVSGLSPVGRDLLINAVTALPAGHDPGLAGLVEAHGVLFDLTRETLELFGLESSLDVLVRAADLPGGGNGQVPAPVAAPAHPTPADAVSDAAAKAVQRARGELEDAREAFGVLNDAHTRAERQCEVASDTRQKIMAALDGGRRDRDQAQARLDALDSGSGPVDANPERQAELHRQMSELAQARDELKEAMDKLEEHDPRAIEVLVEAYHKPPTGEMVPSEQANALADQFAELQSALQELEARMEDEGRGTEAVLRHLDEARAELADAERAVASPSMGPEDITELEAAHEEVIEAEKKASSRLGRKSGQRKLDEAQEREQVILDRVGFPTWSAYVMGSSLLNIDAVAEQRLEKAREDMAEAEADWGRLTEMLENDPEYSALLDQLEAVYLVAFDILGGNDEGDLEQRLRDVRVPEEEVPKSDIVDALAYQLGLREVDIEAQALPDVVVVTAESWLSAADDHWARYRAIEGEHVRVENELVSAQRELDSLGIAAEQKQESDRAELEAALEKSEALVAEILSDLEQATELESELVAQLDARGMLMGAAQMSVTAAEAKLAEAEVQASAPPPAATVTSPENKDTSLYDSLPYAADDGGDDGAAATPDDLEFYFVSRLSSLRSVSHAGSVPLLIDDALTGIDATDVRAILDRLDELSETVQIIYLSDSGDVATWAEDRGWERAAVMHAPDDFG